MPIPNAPTPPFFHSSTLSLLDWAVAARPLAGQSVSGDLQVIAPFPGGALVGVIDGLGHGEEAAAAAAVAATTLTKHAHEPLILLLKQCHEQLKGTRGVVLSVASFTARDNTMTWVGVGNVEGVLWHVNEEGQSSSESLPLRGGVAGYQLPPLRTFVLPVTQGDLLIFVTDGIRSSFARDLSRSDLLRRHTPEELQHLANRILEQHGKSTDDALVLVVRYLGGAP